MEKNVYVYKCNKYDEELVELANQNGGYDNITIITIKNI